MRLRPDSGLVHQHPSSCFLWPLGTVSWEGQGPHSKASSLDIWSSHLPHPRPWPLASWGILLVAFSMQDRVVQEEIQSTVFIPP